MTFGLPKRKKLVRERLSVLSDLLTAKEAHQLFVDIEKFSDGFVVPLEVLKLMMDANGVISSKKVEVDSDTQVGAESAITITDKRVFVEQIHSQIVCDVTVIARSHIVVVSDADIISLFGYTSMGSGAVTLTASETGSVMECGGAEWLNDNGTFTRSVGSMVPCILEENAVIATATGNLQAGDKTGLRIKYRKIK